MWHKCVGLVLGDEAFFQLLLEVDREAARSWHEAACPHCGGRLDYGNFLRKPRGAPEGMTEEFAIRFSLCCSSDGCRRRLTPASVRFLAKRVYVGAAVVLVAAAMQGTTPGRAKRLCESLGMAPRTAMRWLDWWQTRFAEGELFKSLRGLMRGWVQGADLPRALLEAVSESVPQEKALKVLSLLGPVTSATAPAALGV